MGVCLYGRVLAQHIQSPGINLSTGKKKIASGVLVNVDQWALGMNRKAFANFCDVNTEMATMVNIKLAHATTQSPELGGGIGLL
jgi:hypothetical protein